METSGSETRGGADAEPLTLKVDLLHDVLGLDALLLVVDEDLSVLVLRPAAFIHPHLQLRVCTKQEHTPASVTRRILTIHPFL